MYERLSLIAGSWGLVSKYNVVERDADQVLQPALYDYHHV
jgi:hypothetical protein